MARVQHCGFSCEFVEKPPKAVQSECPVCLQVLREPYQTTCCGKSYCQVCINRLKAGRNKCACCNKPINDFPNVGLQQSLYDFKVYCTNKDQGCQWQGELRQLESHLNNNPSQENQFEGCQFTDIQCLYCHLEQGPRSDIRIHQNNSCPKRPFKCIHCNSYNSTYEDVTTNHWPICNYRPEPCPNKCGLTFSRQNIRNRIASHVENDCPLGFIDCEYKRVGCDMKVLRKDMCAHLDENVANHLSLQAVEQQKIANSIKLGDQKSYQMRLLTKGTKLLCENTASHMLLTSEVLVEHKKRKQQDNRDPTMVLSILIIIFAVMAAYITQENNQMKKQIALLTQDLQALQSHASFCPLYINFTNFKLHKKKNDTWFSSPFYTHPKGYKMCLNIHANGHNSSKGTHIAVFLYVMRGQFDDELEWPFCGSFTVELVNQKSTEEHNNNLQKVYVFNETKPYRMTNRVLNRERAKVGLGYDAFTSHGNLWPKYLKNNRLRFFIKYRA